MHVYYKFIIMLRLYLFYCGLSLIIGHGYVLQCCLDNDRSIIMLTSCIRLYLVYMFQSSRMIFKLPTDSLLLLYVVLIGFVAVNTELSGTTRQVPGFI
jgi:hypothetical protein